MSDETSTRLNDLLEYVGHLGKLNQKPTFKIDEHKKYKIFEHQLKGRIGIQHNITDTEGAKIWLRIERLKRISPPPLPENLEAWITLSNDPTANPIVNEKLMKTVSENECQALLNKGLIDKDDISDSLKNSNSSITQKDVILRLENDPSAKKEIDEYLNEQWFTWSEEEKPRRETISIYDSFFSLQQEMESHGEDESIELIWGIGLCRWLCEGHQIDYPLIEKQIEIEIDANDGAILLIPRTLPPNTEVGPFIALENPGVENLLQYGKSFYKNLSDDIEFSPYIHESFEPVLRQASTHLSESGIYWPDTNPDKENREPNTIDESLVLTDSWVIFARPRQTTSFLHDIERFQNELADSQEPIAEPIKKVVSELSDKKVLSGQAFACDTQADSSLSSHDSEKKDLFFPKVFNKEQEQIIDQLETSVGVVVQGPPGTGKTHTIANIICHYLATGRTVLVTSKGEPALSVLQEQIPEELRGLTISLLTNERKGMKQLESAVEMLAAMISRTKRSDLVKQAEELTIRVNQIKRDIILTDDEIKDWGLKQVALVDQKLSGENHKITPMELAEIVVSNSDKHQWLIDEISFADNFFPDFNDNDIANLRQARKVLVKDLENVGKSIPCSEDMLDSANILAIHNDLTQSSKIAEDAKKRNIPLLSTQKENAVDRARNIGKLLKDLSSFLELIEINDWFKPIFYKKFANDETSKRALEIFNDLKQTLDKIYRIKPKFLENDFQLEDPKDKYNNVKEALTKLKEGKKPFGLMSFGNKDIKEIINSIRIDGEMPQTTHQWKMICEYLEFEVYIKKFTLKWNRLSDELNLPKLTYTFSSSKKELDNLYQITSKGDYIIDIWPKLSNEVKELFPYGVNVSVLILDRNEVTKLTEAIDMNCARITFGAQQIKREDLINKIRQSDSTIASKINDFLNDYLGNPKYSSDEILNLWAEFMEELRRLRELLPTFEIVEEITNKIASSGAPNWAEKLRNEPVEVNEEDTWTPSYWFETWQWKGRYQYLQEIDGREQLKKLAKRRAQLDHNLSKAFSDLVKIKTQIGLHSNMTERVQGALMRFVSAVARIGKGTGKRAPRYRRDSFKAMQDCYEGVPCWIMPTWRISESLPSKFGSFDLVIIDEASQSDITALPAILRAKKVLVVGDDKQVSPTGAFFAEDKILQLKHNFLKQQPFSELLLPGVSLYDLANSVFPGQRIMLTEHFRCVEPIIKFSMQFYNEPLVPLRIPKVSERLSPPLIDVYVKGGTRDERKYINEAEAEAIISEICSIVSDSNFIGRTIGVISLVGHKQAKYIQDKLLMELGEDVYQEFQIACGDAATFQGKERDIIFLSMVVGSGQGAVLSKKENEQRINVAMSRARDRMYLYRSITKDDLTNENDLRLKVLKHFSNPMPHLENVSNQIELCDSEFEKQVYLKLLDLGYKVTPQVKVGGFSIDLVVEGENDRRLAVELDGDQYHTPDRWMEDWQRQRILERVGWRFWRCWGSSYTVDPDGCIADLENELTNLHIMPNNNLSDYSNIYSEYREYQPTVNDQYDKDV